MFLGAFGCFSSRCRAPRTHRCVRRQLSDVEFTPGVLPQVPEAGVLRSFPRNGLHFEPKACTESSFELFRALFSRPQLWQHMRPQVYRV